MEGWVKEVAPSTELRQWFGHDPERWSEFRSRYRKELREQARGQGEEPNGLGQLLRAAQKGNVTLLYSARDTEHYGALVLRDFLESKLEACSQRLAMQPALGAHLMSRAPRAAPPAD
jgi:uncharacterized protein YeaO (DUF488 family)